MRVKMPSMSCFSYRLWSRVPYNFTFIKFEKFIKVIVNSRSIILRNDELASHQRLFQIFILSLLLTEDTSTVSYVTDKNEAKYGVETLRYWNKARIAHYYGFVQLEKYSKRNPLNAMEPKRASGDKKVRKFFKLFSLFYENEMIKEPVIIADEFIAREGNEDFAYMERYIKHECRVNMLSSILHKYGSDVYHSVNQFM